MRHGQLQSQKTPQSNQTQSVVQSSCVLLSARLRLRGFVVGHFDTILAKKHKLNLQFAFRFHFRSSGACSGMLTGI
jgi:hypothetical protein